MSKMTDNDQSELHARLEKLKSGLEAHKAADQHQTQSSAPKAENMGQAMSLGIRVLSEFVAAIVVGGLLGWQFDKWLGTAPVLLLLFLLLGIIAGFWNVYRIAAAPPRPAINPDKTGYKTKE